MTTGERGLARKGKIKVAPSAEASAGVQPGVSTWARLGWGATRPSFEKVRTLQAFGHTLHRQICALPDGEGGRMGAWLVCSWRTGGGGIIMDSALAVWGLAPKAEISET